MRRGLPRRRGRRRDRTASASSGSTSRRTPARTPTSAGPPAASTAPTTRWSTTTGPASRSSRSSPSRCPAPGRWPRRWRGPTSPNCARSCARSGVSDVRMEQGSLRCDVNTSLNPTGSDRVGHPDRDQERQLAAQRRAGRALGDHPPGRPARRRAAGSSRRPGTSPSRPATPGPGAARRRRPTTGTSPSPTWSRSRPTRPGSRSCASTCPSCRSRARLRRRASLGRLGRRPRADVERRRRRPGRAPRSRPARRSPRPATGGSATWPSRRTRARSSRPTSAIDPDAGRPADRARRRRHAVGRAGPPGRRRRARDRRRTSIRSIAERGLRLVSDSGALDAGGRRGDRRQPRRRREGEERQGRRDRCAGRRGHEGDPRAGRRGQRPGDPAGAARRRARWQPGR